MTHFDNSLRYGIIDVQALVDWMFSKDAAANLWMDEPVWQCLFEALNFTVLETTTAKGALTDAKVLLAKTPAGEAAPAGGTAADVERLQQEYASKVESQKVAFRTIFREFQETLADHVDHLDQDPERIVRLCVCALRYRILFHVCSVVYTCAVLFTCVQCCLHVCSVVSFQRCADTLYTHKWRTPAIIRMHARMHAHKHPASHIYPFSCTCYLVLNWIDPKGKRRLVSCRCWALQRAGTEVRARALSSSD